ncbi:ribonuclease J [Phototrophicus methaneseepsis]|uniref:Ribonuclease J n=1 Tax=Phototrophicus methaneseepsis TaxID=2710758 RepID=A0A7S8EDK1_9CHLR|nr:ribonuclease J [Phototrophicus methaneseepsis]QPC84999.1 ribonuclease J [Phototrophicus methaneseepsis]
MAKAKLRVIPLGGCGEIGKNMTIIELGDDAIIIDTGIMFPANDMHGVDYIIPDFQYLRDRKDLKIHGVIYTHGHEDHIGAVAHVLEAFPDVPLYASKLTASLINVKFANARRFNEARIEHDPEVNIIYAGTNFNLGPFKIEPFRMTHSIPDCLGFAINTPYGLIVHTGDYKFDNNPVDGKRPDYAKLAEFGKRGVKLLLADSTNSDKPGWTESESTIEPAFDKVFKEAKGRIMIATFASLMSRVQQAADAAKKHGRRIAIAGHTMREYVQIAREIGYLDIPEELLIDIGKINSVEPHKLVIMVTGSQGEPAAVLGKLAAGRHRYLDIRKNDTIVLSSHPIPGNEELVYRTINRLIQRGANLVYDSLENVHVSGHARQEEMRLLLNLVQPLFLVPVHGELRHLVEHKKLGIEAGIPENNIIVVENGTIIEVDTHYVRKGERIPGGYVFVDGRGVGDIGRAVIRDREILARDGFLIVSVNVDKKTGKLVSQPDIVSRGFIYLREADNLLDQVRYTVESTLAENFSANGRRRDLIEESVGKLLYNETRRRPMVFSIVNEV